MLQLCGVLVIVCAFVNNVEGRIIIIERNVSVFVCFPQPLYMCYFTFEKLSVDIAFIIRFLYKPVNGTSYNIYCYRTLT